MKKVLALVVIAGSISLFACTGGEKKADDAAAKAHADSMAMKAKADSTAMKMKADSAAMKMKADSTKMKDSTANKAAAPKADDKAGKMEKKGK